MFAELKRFSFSRLTSEPHRLFFFGGALWLISALFWWLTYLGHKYFHWLPPYQFDPKELHSMQSLYVVLMTFALGFILTTFPKWLARPAYGRGHLVALFVLIPLGGIWQFTGTKLYLAGLLPGSILIFLGYAYVMVLLGSTWAKSEHKGELQPKIALLAISSGVVGMGYFVLYLLGKGPYEYYQYAFGIGMFFMLPLLLLSVAYRILPFFTEVRLQVQDMTRYPWVLKAWAVLLAAKTILFALNHKEWYLITDSLLLVVTLIQFRAWHFLRPKQEPLLSFLYWGLAWFPLGLVIFVLGAIDAQINGVYQQFFELAGIHSWSLGLMTTLVFSMATRVSLGHSGRPLEAKRFEVWIFWLIQAGAVTRVALELLGLLMIEWIFWTFMAGVPILAGMIPWAWRYLPYYWTPRADEEPPANK